MYTTYLNILYKYHTYEKKTKRPIILVKFKFSNRSINVLKNIFTQSLCSRTLKYMDHYLLLHRMLLIFIVYLIMHHHETTRRGKELIRDTTDLSLAVEEKYALLHCRL